MSSTQPRNLIFHCTPVHNYEWSLSQLLSRQTIFTGMKLIAIAQGKLEDGSQLPDWQQVRKKIPLDIKCIPVENDLVLRETASLSELLKRLHVQAPDTGITFYAHTKGTSRTDSPPKMQEAIRLWTQIMYEQNLDRLKDVEKILENHSCSGAFKRYGRFGHFPRTSHWHYSGTFFWFRNKDLFERNWQQVPRSRYGTEAYLSTLFDKNEAGCIFGDGVTDLYNVNYLRRVLQIKDGSPSGKKTGPGIPVAPRVQQIGRKN